MIRWRACAAGGSNVRILVINVNVIVVSVVAVFRQQRGFAEMRGLHDKPARPPLAQQEHRERGIKPPLSANHLAAAHNWALLEPKQVT